MSKAERPDSVWVGATFYTIDYDHDEFMILCGESRRSLLGVSNHHNLTIKIDGAVAEQVVRDTLMHEIMHCIFAESGLSTVMEQMTEEELLCTVTPRLISMMRVNPEVMAYMLGSTDGE